MTNLYWIHEDALRLNHPAAQAAGEAAHSFFIWDDTYLQAMDYGFHRLHFIYEALCDMGVTIYKGDTIDSLKQLMSEHNAHNIYVANSVNPKIHEHIENIKSSFNLHVIDEEPFVILPRQPELKRFFKYWNKAYKVAFEEHGGASSV